MEFNLVMIEAVPHLCCLAIELAFMATWYSDGLATEKSSSIPVSGMWIFTDPYYNTQTFHLN